MPVPGLFDELLGRDTRGNAVLEFALVLPALLLLFAGIVEVGRAYSQANAVEKGLRAGAFYAARQSIPLSAAKRSAAENLIKTGTLDGTGPLLASAWSRPGADVDIDDSATFALGGIALPVIRVTATVPFDPILPGLLSFVGLGDYTITLSHEQAYVGD